ncbi:MAG: hypothetical protein QUS09_02265, partial [Methanotrichaceae archaeon]|nr:hypothetical protein [Methanotrichaceae archaeon]
IDTLLTLFSIAGIVILFRAYLNYSYYPDAKSTAILLGLLFVLYYAARGALKLYLERMPENTGFHCTAYEKSLQVEVCHEDRDKRGH